MNPIYIMPTNFNTKSKIDLKRTSNKGNKNNLNQTTKTVVAKETNSSSNLDSSMQYADSYMNEDTEYPSLKIKSMKKPQYSNLLDIELSKDKLQEAIILSEVLGKPMCKRRKRTHYGY